MEWNGAKRSGVEWNRTKKNITTELIRIEHTKKNKNKANGLKETRII